MAITEVTITDFRKDLKTHLDQVDAGVTLVLSRGGIKRYTLLPVRDEDLDFTPEMYQDIEEAMAEIKQGKGTEVVGVSGIDMYFDNL